MERTLPSNAAFEKYDEASNAKLWVWSWMAERWPGQPVGNLGASLNVKDVLPPNKEPELDKSSRERRSKDWRQ
jgi:hypothetical protein